MFQSEDVAGNGHGQQHSAGWFRIRDGAERSTSGQSLVGCQPNAVLRADRRGPDTNGKFRAFQFRPYCFVPFSVDDWGAGEVDGGLFGCAFYAVNHSSATVANLTGTFTQAYQLGNGTVDEIDGLYSEVGNASTGGTVETVAAGKFIIDNDIESGPGGTTTNTYGVWVTSPGSNPGPETHLHGIHIDDQTVGGSNNQDPVAGESSKRNPTEKNALGSINIGGQSGPLICTGTGIPNGVVTAPVGSLYLRQDGGTSSTLYVKESGGLYKFWLGRKMTKKRLVLDCFLFDFISFGVRWCRVEQGRTSGDIPKPLLVPVTETARFAWRASLFDPKNGSKRGSSFIEG